MLLRIENRSSNARAEAEVIAAVQSLLAQKRYDVVSEAQAAPPLEIDRAGAATPAAVRDALASARADALVTVSIGFLLEGQARSRGPSATAAIGLQARMYSRDARAVWRNSLAVIVEQPAVPVNKQTYVAGARRDATYKSPTAAACEQLLWTLPQGHRSPEELAARAAPPAPVPTAVKSTRYENAPRRAQSSPQIARFPLRIDRVP